MISIDNRKKGVFEWFKNENKYNEYKKSGKKPSIFCKDILLHKM